MWKIHWSCCLEKAILSLPMVNPTYKPVMTKISLDRLFTSLLTAMHSKQKNKFPIIIIFTVSFFNLLELVFRQGILYPLMLLMLIRASLLPSKFLVRPHFFKWMFNKIFCFFTCPHASPTRFVVKTRISPAVSFPSTYNSRFASKCCLTSSCI